MTEEKDKGFVELLQVFSIPLLAGVVVALFAANIWPDTYAHSLHWKPFGHLSIYGHELTLHFLVNDIFMVFFFGIAAKEITEACLPGGSLNPISKAVTPLIATLGGVVGPIAVFFAGLWMAFQFGIYDPAVDDRALLQNGWGIPTATDIALAWLLARSVFGAGHPAIAFLLLLAVADDAIGLVIIAGFYGDPAHPVAPAFLLLVLAGMGIAWGLRRAGVMSWIPYVAIGGPVAWSGLVLAHLHPALALVLIVPFLPGPSRDTGLFVDEDVVDLGQSVDAHETHSPLHMFEHHLKLFVDMGLFFFAFCNAGVQFAAIGPLTWLILGALVIGKTVGVTSAASISLMIGFALPEGMSKRDLVMAGFIAALGLTVALFVASAAYQDPVIQGQAKMGALFSGLVFLPAVLIGRALGLKRSGEASAGSENESPVGGGAPAPEPLPASPRD